MSERKHVLVPFDGSEQAREALDHALTEFADDRITLLNVIDPVDAGYSVGAGSIGRSEEWYEQARDAAENLLDEATEVARERGVEVHSTTELGRPARTIVKYAEEEGFDQIVMGSHGRSGVSRILLGSVAENVVRRSPVPVTVVR